MKMDSANSPAAAPPRAQVTVMERPAPSGFKGILNSVLGERQYRMLRQAQWSAATDWRDPRFTLSEKLRAWRLGFTADSAALYEFPRANWHEYLSDYVAQNHSAYLNPVPHFFEQKLILRALLLQHGFKQAETFALIARADVQLDPLGPQCRMVTLEEANAAMQLDGGPFIVKPEDGRGGAGIALVTVKDGRLLRFRGDRISDYRVKASWTPTLVERAVPQHETWQSFFSGSANTMRLLTMWTPGDPAPFIAAASQRIGSSHTAPIDNFTRGGLAATIDVQTGVLGQARRRDASGRPQRLTHHHETGTRIEGVQLPAWDRVRETVLSAASLLGVARYIGWDVMMDTTATPVIIEGNNNPAVHTLQIDSGLLRLPEVRRFFDVYGVL
jgi:hypothetical protein